MTKGADTGAMWMEAQDASSAADLLPIQVGAQHSSRNNSMKIWTDYLRFANIRRGDFHCWWRCCGWRKVRSIETKQTNKATQPVTSGKANDVWGRNVIKAPPFGSSCEQHFFRHHTQTRIHTHTPDFTKSCDITIIGKMEEEEGASLRRGRS